MVREPRFEHHWCRATRWAATSSSTSSSSSHKHPRLKVSKFQSYFFPLYISSCTAFQQMHLQRRQSEWYLFLSLASLNSAGSKLQKYPQNMAGEKQTYHFENELWTASSGFATSRKIFSSPRSSGYDVASWQPLRFVVVEKMFMIRIWVSTQLLEHTDI